MDLLTVLVYALIALWLVAVVAAALRVYKRRTPRLRPLSQELYDRFEASWEGISRRFVDSPREAAHEADALVLSLLVERGHPVEGNRLPGGVQDARRWLAREHAEGTEALRQAMLQYQIVLKRMVGSRPREATENRREMA